MSHPAPRDSTAFEVREALDEPGCAICRLALRSTTRMIRAIAYEQINDVDLRYALRRARASATRMRTSGCARRTTCSARR